MGNKYFRTKCYWFNEHQDMNAIIPTCDYYGQYGSCPCSEECEHYISEQEVESIIRKRAEAEWIPCSEKLPKTGDSVLATYSDGEVGIIWDARPKLWGTYMKNSHLIYPIAWMPLPKPHEEDGEV